MKKFVLFICFLCMIEFVAAIQINEILPNPHGDDNNKEFVEILSSGFVNLSSFIIGDNASNDTLIALQYFDSNYTLIVEEGFNYSDINASIYSAGATIGNNLGNSGDAVFFFAPNGTVLAFVFYETVQEGYSYEKNESWWFLSRIENGTPGRENSITSFIGIFNESNEFFVEQNVSETIENPKHNSVTLTVIFPSEIYSNKTIASGFRIENNGEEKITARLEYTVSLNDTTIMNETKLFENISQYRTKDTVAITIQEAGNYTLCGTATSNTTEENFSDNTACAFFIVIDPTLLFCDKKMTIEVDKLIFQNNEAIRFLPMITGDYADFPFVFSYWIEEFSGTIVKEQWISSTPSTKQWTPDIHKQYAVYEIHATLLETTCIDTNPDNNNALTYVVVENPLYEEDSLSIKQAKQNTGEKNTEEEQAQEKEEKKSEEEYSLITFPSKAYVNETIKSFILLQNTYSETHIYKVSSKIYRGPKTYAGADFENRETITLSPGEKEYIALQNSLMNISPGTYKIKIQIQKDDYKTLKEFRDELLILENFSSEENILAFLSKNETNKTADQTTVLSPLKNKFENKTAPVFTVSEDSTSSSETGTPIAGEVLAQGLSYESPLSKIRLIIPYILGLFVLLFGITLFFYKV